MNVPLLDLKAQYATLKDKMMPAIEEVMEAQWFIGGPNVTALEEAVAEYSGCSKGIGVSSGTDALLASLMVLDIGQGDEVITTPFTFFATVGSIWRTGARPVFVDIEPDTYNIDPAKIEAAVTENTKAIIPVHLYGQMCDMDPIMAIAEKHNLYVIEDAAQSIGSTYKGRKAGSIGTTGCFSFFPSKNLGCNGDGGMVVTNDVELGDKIAMFRNHGMQPKYFHKFIGGNFRLDALQAAALLVKLPHLEGWSAGRRANAARYNELLADCDEVTTPVIREENVTIFNQYVIRVPNRDACKQFILDAGIGCDVYYPLCLHQQECFAPLGYNDGDFPVSEQAATEVIALPIYSELTDEQIQYVAGKVKEFIAG
ncbi:MAG: DegT/DnrJ/EryC1/StrS family aminotransferase [Phycisphaerae bacterium]|nr:DegT/DnrJ/EryC1/StrS family aminotransferase [Phycisphaerae bacterium]